MAWNKSAGGYLAVEPSIDHHLSYPLRADRVPSGPLIFVDRVGVTRRKDRANLPTSSYPVPEDLEVSLHVAVPSHSTPAEPLFTYTLALVNATASILRNGPAALDAFAMHLRLSRVLQWAISRFCLPRQD